MGQRTAIILQHRNIEDKTTNTKAFYCQWGIGRIMPSQLISILNGTLSVRCSRPDFIEALRPQGTRLCEQPINKGDLWNNLDFEEPQEIGNVIQSLDNNNGGIFLRITTDKYDIQKIEYAYMLGYAEGGKYKKFCTEEAWLEKAGEHYIDADFKAYYNAIIKYFGAKEYKQKEL